jgi:hypothetical protein
VIDPEEVADRGLIRCLKCGSACAWVGTVFAFECPNSFVEDGHMDAEGAGIELLEPLWFEDEDAGVGE